MPQEQGLSGLPICKRLQSQTQELTTRFVTTPGHVSTTDVVSYLDFSITSRDKVSRMPTSPVSLPHPMTS
jgi:hypothetical protein